MVTICTSSFSIQIQQYMKLDTRCFGMLRRVDLYLVTDVSEQRIGPIFKSQAVKLTCANRHRYHLFKF